MIPGRKLLPAALVILSAAILTLAQSAKTNTRPDNAPSPEKTVTTPKAEDVEPKKDDTHYSYEFTQPQFYIHHILIEHDSTGRGRITFERLNEEAPVVEPLRISDAAMTRILALYDSLSFLNSQTNYQSEKQFPHLGTVRLKMEQGGRKRTAEFNWTSDRNAAMLVDEYRRVADQANFVFDMSVARENQPLNAPKLMDGLEILFNRNGLSDPQQLVTLLKEITTDDHLPLIARNHATRLLKKIETKKN